MTDQADSTAVNAKNLAVGTRWVALGRIVTQGSRFLVSIILARLLSPDAFGLIAVAMTTIIVLDVVKDLGTGAAVIQRKEADQRLLSSVFFLNAGVGTLGAVSMAVWAGPIARLFNTPEAEPVVRALAVVVLLYSLSQTHHAMIRRTMRFNVVAGVEVCSALTNAVVSISLALAGWGVWAMVWGNIAGTVVGTMLAWVRAGWQPSLKFSITSLRQIAGYSLHTTAFNGITLLLRNTDKLLVGRWLGAAPLGIYSLGQRTITYPMESIAQVLMTVLFPAFARIQDDNEALRRGYVRATGAISFVTLPLMVGGAVVAEPLVEVALGDQWRDLVPLLWFMAPAGAVAAILSAVNTLYSAKGRADWMFRWGVASGTFTLLGFVVGLNWGLVGLALAYLIVTLVQTPIGLWIALRLIDMPVRTLLAAQRPYLLMTAVMAAAAGTAAYGSAAAGATSLLQLVVGVLAGAIAYVGVALWVRPPALADLITLVRR